MQYESTDAAEEGFLARVQHQSGLTSRAEARQLSDATLGALATAVSSGQLADLTRHLPNAVQPSDHSPGHATSFDKGAFLDAVSGGVPSTDLEEVEILTSAVLNVVREEAPQEQVTDTLAQLPPELAALFQSSRDTRGA